MKPYIPQPCHEDWNVMTPKEKGRFCEVCAKVVVDFTQMNDDEIIDYLQQHAKQKTCGHFRNDQLIQKEKIYIDLSILPKNLPFKNIFIACFISFFSSLFFISCHGNNNEITSGVIDIIDSTKIRNNDTLKNSDNAKRNSNTSKVLLKTEVLKQDAEAWTGGAPAILPVYVTPPEPALEAPIPYPSEIDTNKIKNTDIKIILDTTIYKSDTIK